MTHESTTALNRPQEPGESDEIYWERIADYYDSDEGAREMYDGFINADEVHVGGPHGTTYRGAEARFLGRVVFVDKPFDSVHDRKLLEDEALVTAVANLAEDDLRAFLTNDSTYNIEIKQLLQAVGVKVSADS